MGKLHDQMEGDLILKAYSPHTQKAYLRGGYPYQDSEVFQVD